MSAPNNQPNESGPSFFSIIPIVGRLLWSYAKRLISVDTLASLEKKQGNGSGEKSIEVELYERALERNPNHYHFTNDEITNLKSQDGQRFDNAVLYVKKEGQE